MYKFRKIVTIDGPSGAGKSTVSRKLAAKLIFTYLDTGAMYRAVALKCKISGVDIGEEKNLQTILKNLDIRLLPAAHENEDVRVFLDGCEVGQQIRTEEISMLASRVSALVSVRNKLTGMQRKIGYQGEVVAEGRDMGTFVFPDAAWKFFLDADPEERARRRTEQFRTQGKVVDEKEVLRQIIKRDRNDRQRSIAPLKIAIDALRINSTNLAPDEIVACMLAHIEQHKV